MLESMTYNKRLLNYVRKFIEKQESSTSPNTECNGKSDGTVFQTLFPCAVESELSVNSVRAWLKVVTHCHFHHVHNLHSVVLYRPYSHTHTLTHTHTHSLTLTHILTHSLTRTLTHSLSLTHSLTHTHTLTHSLIFSQNKTLQYIQQEDPDIFCLQETKCAEDDLPKVLTVCTLVVVTVCVSNCVHFCRNSEGYHSYWSSDQKGYSRTR